MPNAHTQRRELKNTGYEIFIGLLSVLSIVNLVLLFAINAPVSTRCCTSWTRSSAESS